MKVFIIAALTADGFISRNPGHSPLQWRSQGDKQFFIARTKEAKVVVMGMNTAKTSKRPMPDRLNIIYAVNKEELPRWKEFEGWEVTQKDPAVLVQELSERGYDQVAICGGSTIYAMFMRAGVVNTLYLTMEPVLFGQGMNLFNQEVDKRLTLVSTTKLEDNTLLLEYGVGN